MCLYPLSTSPCLQLLQAPPLRQPFPTAGAELETWRENLWTSSNEMKARADESFEVFSSGRSSMSFGGGTTTCSFVAQYYSNAPVTARGLAITPDDVRECEPAALPLADCGCPFGWQCCLSPHPLPTHSFAKHSLSPPRLR